ncbi:MAG: DUF1311 domain-containing protein [Neisseriaceae bacterium]|nr:DUF1311 domain-containing protein [Neisseriaceae bacterium]
MKIKHLLIACILILVQMVTYAEPIAIDKGSDTEYQWVMEQLNDTYSRVLKNYANNRAFTEQLKKSQQAWTKFRNAEMNAIFPHGANTSHYGNYYNAARLHWLSKLDQQRTAQLWRWLNLSLSNNPQSRLKQLEKTMNATYNNILKKHENDKDFVKKLKASQSAWNKFRKAEINAIKKSDYFGYSIPNANDYWSGKLVEDRILQLERWE